MLPPHQGGSTSSTFRKRPYLFCEQSFRAFGDFEFHPLTLLQALVAFHLDDGEMREYVRAAAIRRYEPKPLGIVEPFHDTRGHFAVAPPDSATLVAASNPGKDAGRIYR